VFEFLLVIVISKIIPYYIIRNEYIKVNDIIFTLLLFNLYLVWLLINKKDFKAITSTIMNSLLKDDHKTPFMFFFKKIETYFK